MMNSRSYPLIRLLVLGWLIGLALLGMAALPTQAQSTPPTLATYEGWLREALVAAQRRDRLGLEAIAPRIFETSTLQLPDGSSVPIDNRWLREALDANDPDLERIAERLGALLDALAQPDTTTPADAQQRLRDLLSRPPFANEAPDESLIGRFLDWIFRTLDSIFSPIGNIGPTPGNVLGWLITIAGVILVLVILAYWLLGLRRSLAREARNAPTDDPEAGLTANSAFQQASSLARGGDYRTAVRYLYLSSLLWLDERGLLRYDRALTNHEYLEHLHNNPELRARLEPIVETFDRVWYGYAQIDAASFSAYQQQVEGLRKLRGGTQ